MYIAWDTIVTSVQMVSHDLQPTMWHSWLTFLLYIRMTYETKVLIAKNILHEKQLTLYEKIIHNDNYWHNLS